MFGPINTLTTIRASFRMIPAFGLDIIRRFTNNISGMKQLAARDFEDISQVHLWTLSAPTHSPSIP